MRQHDRSLVCHAGIAISRVGSDLLMAHVDELNCAACHCRQDCDVRVSAKAEDVTCTPSFEITHQKFGNCFLHD